MAARKLEEQCAEGLRGQKASNVRRGGHGMTLPDCVVLMIIGFSAGAGTGAAGAAAAAGRADESTTVAPGGAVWPGWSWTYWIGTWNVAAEPGPPCAACWPYSAGA